jgi:hypothetical protein
MHATCLLHVQAARDARQKEVDAANAAAEELEAKARELAEAGKGSTTAAESEDTMNFAKAEKEYYALEAQFKERLGIGSVEDGG